MFTRSAITAGWNPERFLLASRMKRHCHRRQDWGLSHVGTWYGTRVPIRKETAWLKGDKDLVFFCCLTFLSEFLGLSLPVLNHALGASFECGSLSQQNAVSSGEGRLQWLVQGGSSAAGPSAGEALSAGRSEPVGRGSSRGPFISRRSVSEQGVSLRMLYLWKSIFLLTNLYLTGFLLKQQPPPGQVNVTVAAVSVPRGLPASRIQLDTFVCKCFKYFSWNAIKE